jgi:hypothetical protein
MTRPVAILTVALATSIALVLVVVGGSTALAYFGVFLLATLPGLPLGFLLFGHRHAAGWIAGALLGYATTCLIVWGTIYTGHASTTVHALMWLAALVSTTGAWRLFPDRDRRHRRHYSHVRLKPDATSVLKPDATSALVALPPWSTTSTTALLLVLLLVPALVGPPFARIGSVDANGDKRYRAYFTADFVWHMAMTAELQKHDQPPVNPYLAPEPIHYYWTYFLVPAAAGPVVGADVELALKVNAMATALLLVSAVFLAAWAALPAYPFAVAGAVALVVVAASLEGLAALAYVFQQGQGLAGLRDLNVDALSRGVGGLRIDNLARAMWYTPQHSMSYALGLVALPVAIAGGLEAGAAAILLAGLALGASVAFNPFVGGLLCAVYGLAVLGHWWRAGGSFVPVLRHGAAIVPVVAALAWASLNKVTDGAGSTLHFGPYGPAANAPLLAFILSFGPLLVLTVIGLLPNRRVPLASIWPALSGLVLVILVMHLVTMTVDEFWIGFRTGHLVFVLVPPIVARALLWLDHQPSRVLAWSVVSGVLAIGAPTTVIDAFNAQDVENTHEGIGITWVVRLTPEEQQGLAWIRANTPPAAIVQADPAARGRDTWSLIPSFAGRRMAAGQPISLMHVADYDTRSDAVQKIYGYGDPQPAWRSAVDLGIDYLWVDRVERTAYPNVKKFDDHPEWFVPVFRNAEVTVYRISRDDSARTSGSQ